MFDAPAHYEAEPPTLLEASMPPDEQPLSPEAAYDDGLPLFSQHGVVPEVPQTQEVSRTSEAEESLAVTSAPLLTNPSLTDMPISIPQLPNDTSNLQDTEARNTGYPVPTNPLHGTTSLARVVGADRELFYLVVRQEQQIPSLSAHACALKGRQFAEDVLEDDLLDGAEDTLPFLHSKQLVKLTRSHHLHRIPIQMRPPRSSHPILTKVRRRSTRAMVYAGWFTLGIVVEPAGSVIAFASWL